MLRTIFDLLTGGLLDKVLGFFDRRDQRRVDAMTSERRQRHDERMAGRVAAKGIRKATAIFWEMRLLSFLIALPFVVHLWSIWLDTQFDFISWGIPPFPEPFDQWQREIILSFFGVSALVGSARAVAGAIAYRRR